MGRDIWERVGEGRLILSSTHLLQLVLVDTRGRRPIPQQGGALDPFRSEVSEKLLTDREELVLEGGLHHSAALGRLLGRPPRAHHLFETREQRAHLFRARLSKKKKKACAPLWRAPVESRAGDSELKTKGIEWARRLGGGGGGGGPPPARGSRSVRNVGPRCFFGFSSCQDMFVLLASFRRAMSNAFFHVCFCVRECFFLFFCFLCFCFCVFSLFLCASFRFSYSARSISICSAS